MASLLASESVRSHSSHPFDETSRRMLARRPKFEKDYQKDLTFYLTKACEYLPWRFYVEVELYFQGRKRYIDFVLETDKPQHILMELKKGVITVDVIKEVLSKNYIEGYRECTGEYPLLSLFLTDLTET